MDEVRPKPTLPCSFARNISLKTMLACQKQAQKREDIQGLRAIAILSVVLFHIWPDFFRHGYLGVDIFFVISGYLMAQILSSSSSLGQPSNSNALLFYFRRIHRIVPSYLLVVFLTLVVGQSVLVGTEFQVLRSDALWSLTFTTNLNKMLQIANYFAEVATDQFFLHTWSLAVEMQFYLIAPLTIWLLMRLKTLRSLIITCVVVIALSRLLQFVCPTRMAFSLTFCRMWQFFVGILTHFIGAARANSHTKEEWMEKCCLRRLILGFNSLFSKRIQSYFAICLLTTLLLLPNLHIPFPAPFQFAVVVITALLLNCEERPWLLGNGVMVRVGDLSYIWYLAHWPLIKFIKYRLSYPSFPLIDGALVFVLTIFLAILLDELFDRVVRKLKEKRVIGLLIAVLFMSCLGLLLPYYIIAQKSEKMLSFIQPNPREDASFRVFHSEYVPINQYANRFLDLIDHHQTLHLSREERIAINHKIMDVTSEYLEALGARREFPRRNVLDEWNAMFEQEGLMEERLEGSNGSKWQFRFTSKGTGNLSVILVGNSHADQIATEMSSLWKEKYDVLEVFTLGVCLPIDVHYGWPRYDEKRCIAYSKQVLKLVKERRPDVLFLNFYWDMMGHSPMSQAPQADPIVADFQATLEQLQESVKQTIFLGAPNLYFEQQITRELEKRLWWNSSSSIDQLNQPYDEHKERSRPHWDRLKQVQCAKCRIVDWTEAFCDGEGVCRAFEPSTQLAYFTDEHHYTFLGCHKIRPLMKKLGNEL